MKKRFLRYVLFILCMVLTMLSQAVMAAGGVPTGNLLINPGGEESAGGLLRSNGWEEDTSPERGYSYTAFNNGPNKNGIVLSLHGGTYFEIIYSGDILRVPQS